MPTVTSKHPNHLVIGVGAAVTAAAAAVLPPGTAQAATTSDKTGTTNGYGTRTWPTVASSAG